MCLRARGGARASWHQERIWIRGADLLCLAHRVPGLQGTDTVHIAWSSSSIQITYIHPHNIKLICDFAKKMTDITKIKIVFPCVYIKMTLNAFVLCISICVVFADGL
jgi:hypothetical protein